MVVIPREVYIAMVHEAEEGGYWGEVTNLPGCVSQGETLGELETNLLEAIEAVTEASAENVNMMLTHDQEDYWHSAFITQDASETDGWSVVAPGSGNAVGTAYS